MNKENTQVSIVILTKNGGELLEKSVRMIFQQEASFNYEVIVIDSGSTDGTLEVLKKYPVFVFKVNPEDFSFGPTREYGFSKANGDYIVTLSQDVVPVSKNWLKNLISPLLSDKADVVQGHIAAPCDKKVFFWEKKELFYFTSEGKEFRRSHGGINLSCTNLAIKKSVWKETGFGNAPMNEDVFLQKKVFQKGYRMIKQNEAIAHHGHTYNLLSLIKRCENEGMGWKYAGVKYSFVQMARDLIQEKWVYGTFIRGIITREVTNISELLFLIIRPIFLYKGNLFLKKYKN